MKRRQVLVAVGLVLAAVLGGLLLARPAENPGAAQVHASPAPGPSARAPAALPPAVSAAAPGAPSAPVAVPAGMPGSLQGTEADGALRVDAQGNLVLSREVRSFFEYYLAATGEESQEVLRARILAAISTRLSPRAAQQATALLDKYLAYREAAKTLTVAGGDRAPLEARIEAVRKLRREHLGSEASAALFGEDEAVETVALERAKLAADKSLAPEERQRREEELEALLPEEVRAARAEALSPLRQQQAEERLRAAGATAEALHQHRVETVGAEAAARLDALDQQRAEWQQRLDAYRAQRQELDKANLSEEARQAALEALRSRSFTGPERTRIEALDRIEAERLQPGQPQR